jgi:glycosyltransferase involved in cell wall biosynthesis
MKEEVCKKFDIDSKFVGTWSSGVSTTLFNPDSYIHESEELKRKLGLTKKFVVFYHGAFTTNRGLRETIEAMRIVKRNSPDVILFLLGTGSVANNLKNLIRVNSLQDNVVIHSPVDYADVPKYIAMSDVGIVPLPNHPYWKHQCPLNLLEYLAMGKTVIATDIPANRLVIREQKCGIYISSVKSTEIEKAIEYAYHNKEKLTHWGATGRAIIEKNYTWEKVATNFGNYLLSIDGSAHPTARHRKQ